MSTDCAQGSPLARLAQERFHQAMEENEDNPMTDFARKYTLDEWREAARCMKTGTTPGDLTITETARSIHFQGSAGSIESRLAEADKTFDRHALFAVPGVIMAGAGIFLKEGPFSRPMRVFGGAWTAYGVLQELVKKPQYHKSLESFKDTDVAKSELRAEP